MTPANPAETGETISIRHARPDDLDAVAAIMESEHVNIGTQRLPYHPQSVIEARIADDPAKFKLVAEIEGRIAGYGELETWPGKPRLRHGGEIDMIATHPDFRGRGVGRALLTALIDLADRWLQLSRLQLFVWDGNTTAIRLYEDFGFDVEGRLRHFVFVDGGYRDAFVMARLNPVLIPTGGPAASPDQPQA